MRHNTNLFLQTFYKTVSLDVIQDFIVVYTVRVGIYSRLY